MCQQTVHQPFALFKTPLNMFVFLAACFVSYEGSLATMTCTHGWNIWQTPEGYYYYYNTATQGTMIVINLIGRLLITIDSTS